MFLVEVVSGLLRPAGCLACGAPDGWPCCARCLPPDPGDVGPWPLAADPAGTSFVLTARSSTGASLWMVNRQDKAVTYLTLPTPNAFDSDPSFASR